MVIFEIFKRQNLIKIYTKTHHFKKISRGLNCKLFVKTIHNIFR